MATAATVNAVVGDAVTAVPSKILELPVQVLPQLALRNLGTGTRAGAIVLVLDREHVVGVDDG